MADPEVTMYRTASHLLNGNGGNILVVTILILFGVSVIGTTLAMISSTDLKISGNQRTHTTALYVAEAGLNEVLHRVALSDPTDATVGGWTGNAAIRDPNDPVDPNWESRGRNVQQYELRVRRMDVRFDEKLRELYDSAMSRGLWKGTAAVHNHVEYWAEGVLVYFDAVGAVAAPNDAEHPIATRESLKQYDPGLFALVQETMAYKGKVDWRYRK